jgi:hypothetical protein
MGSAYVNLKSSDGTTPTAKLGQVHSVGGVDYIYCKSGGAIAQYAACTISNAGVAVEGTTTTSGAKPTVVVVPQFAVAAADEYFWGWNGGRSAITDFEGNPFYVKAAQDCATSVKLYTTATPGVVDDSATDLIEGLLLTETITTARAATCIGVKNFVTNCQD